MMMNNKTKAITVWIAKNKNLFKSATTEAQAEKILEAAGELYRRGYDAGFSSGKNSNAKPTALEICK